MAADDHYAVALLAVDCLTVERRRPIHLNVLLPRPNPTQNSDVHIFIFVKQKKFTQPNTGQT